MSDKSPSEQLRNICAALTQDLNESPFTREEWERLDAERLELLASNDALAAELAAVKAEADRRTREVEMCFVVQRDLKARLAEAVAWAKEQGHARWCAVHRPALYSGRPCDCGLARIEGLTVTPSADGAAP